MSEYAGPPKRPEVASSRTVIVCECGERVELGHPENNPYICTTCRRFWSVRVQVAWEHEHDHNPRTAIYALATALDHIRKGRPVEKAIEGTGADMTLNALAQQDRIGPLPPWAEDDRPGHIEDGAANGDR